MAKGFSRNPLSSATSVHIFDGIIAKCRVTGKAIQKFRRNFTFRRKNDIFSRSKSYFQSIKEIYKSGLSIFKTWSDSCQESISIRETHASSE